MKKFQNLALCLPVLLRRRPPLTAQHIHRAIRSDEKRNNLCTCRPQKYVCPPKKETNYLLPIALTLLLAAFGGAFYVANYCPDTMDDLWLNNSPVYPYLSYLNMQEETPEEKKRKEALRKKWEKEQKAKAKKK